MDETLGVKNQHYRCAGLGYDRIRSPEYCAKQAVDQIKILKCYKACKSSLKVISSEAKKHNVELDESFEEQIWGTELMENEEGNEEHVEQGYYNFIFMDNYVPIGNNKVEHISKLKFADDIVVGSCQDGLEITVPNDSGHFEMFKIADTHYDTIKKMPFVIKFQTLIAGKVEVIEND